MEQRSSTPPIVFRPSMSGPQELHFEGAALGADEDSYYEGDSTESAPRLAAGMSSPPAPTTDLLSVSAVNIALPAAYDGPSSRQALNSIRSTPALSASKQAGRVKDMANRIDHGQPPTSTNTSRDRYRRPVAPGTSIPTFVSNNGEPRKLQKRPRKSPSTSFESSFSSATTSSTIRTTRSQPPGPGSPKRARSPKKPPRNANSRPLFGEITADGRWNGNFDLGNYGPLPSFEKTRRGSEGSLALNHGRSQSHQDIASSTLATPSWQKLTHKRSRSDLDGLRNMVIPSMPTLNAQGTYPTPPDSASRGTRQYGHSRSSSRIPVTSRRQSTESTESSNGYPRASSAMSNPASRRRIEKSPTRTAATSKDPNISRSRYHPPSIGSSQTGQMLSAKIVAPLPKTSPPLRSSRPRQPVSSATTSASRARAAERFQGSATNTSPKDARRPSEQWLGKPYDAQKERSRRNIPELSKIDFEERRARIQKAITQSLKSSASQESITRSQSRSASRGVSSRTPSRLASHELGQPSPTELPIRLDSDALQGPGANYGREDSATCYPAEADNYSRGLSVDTTSHLESYHAEHEPLTARTDKTDQTLFEDESPVLGRAVADPDNFHPEEATDQATILLAPVAYQAPKQMDRQTTPKTSLDLVENSDYSGHGMHRRSLSMASRLTTDCANDNGHASDSPRDAGDMWGLRNADQGSIRIMLDDDPNINHHSVPWLNDASNGLQESRSHAEPEPQVLHSRGERAPEFASEEPSASIGAYPSEVAQHSTPRKLPLRENTLKPEVPQIRAPSDTVDSDDSIARVLDYYSSNGILTDEMLAEMQHRVLDLHRLSANGGSDANMIQSLLESIMGSRPPPVNTALKPSISQNTYEIPAITPDTPPLDGSFEPGTVIVYGGDARPDDNNDEDDFEAKIRKADEEWERQQRGEVEAFAEADDQEDKPPPPPKDFGYSPRTSTGPINTSFLPSLGDGGLKISTTSPLDVADVHAAGDRVELTSPTTYMASPLPISAPPFPMQPPPPPPADTKPSLNPMDTHSNQAFSERASSELSPNMPRTVWAPSGSSRPSMDSQRVAPQVPASMSMTSFSDSARQASFETNADGQTRLVKTVSPGPEQKRLLRRRHIMKELLDTENSYHQDLKIIEDIYKATCTPELVAPEDKKVLFGNCDDVEKFALHFYDELRRAATQVYVPPKQQRYMNNKRSSFSTTQSDGTTQTTADHVDDEKDRLTSIGQTFLANLTQMEKIYGTYLKNHDAANQRLSSIQSTNTVKCWLDECHANASDITSAWNLDSLLVKPTQRVAKYPMLLKDLLDVTPEDHPDYEDLQTASRDIVGMLTRINDAKKRADIVDQMINKGKHRKDSDLRGGLSKAFGRRTEKLKERVGIAEAFQDMEFDELAHKFGGHFIRLQICMRDVQDYVHRADQGIALVNAYVESLELFTDLHDHQLAEITSKWRRYGQIIRELTLISFGDHKAAVQKRVLAPMIQCIKLHEGPQAAINKRKKKIVDYAKCKSDERRGQKPDKKTQEASDAYVALNETLKAELPQLYKLTAKLVQHCLHCFLEIQLKWHSDWEKKLSPVLEASDIPTSIQQIVPAFRPDYAEVEKSLTQLSICNGSLKHEAANFLSPTTTLVDKSEAPSINKQSRTPTIGSSDRTMSVGSESSTAANGRRYSGIYNGSSEMPVPADARARSNSSLSNRATAHGSIAGVSANRPWSHSNTPTSSFSMSRPTTGNTPSGSYYIRQSSEMQRSPRPESNATYFTARPELDSHRFSGLFTSAYPPEVGTPQRPSSPARTAPEDMPVLFVCASLFEFSIDRTRREGGYPYLQYVQGEVFDVVAQKGELWLAKNQDDPNNELGWIWEQHFIMLSSE